IDLGILLAPITCSVMRSISRNGSNRISAMSASSSGLPHRLHTKLWQGTAIPSLVTGSPKAGGRLHPGTQVGAGRGSSPDPTRRLPPGWSAVEGALWRQQQQRLVEYRGSQAEHMTGAGQDHHDLTDRVYDQRQRGEQHRDDQVDAVLGDRD